MHKLPLRHLRILHLDSDPHFAQQVLLSLLDHPTPPHAVIHVSTLAEALVTLANEPVDVILSDLKVSDSDGTATCDALREAASRVPLVILTTKNDIDLALSAVRAGAQDYVLKDEVDSRQLMRTIHFAIAWQRRQRSPQFAAAMSHAKPQSDGADQLSETGEDALRLGTSDRPIRVLQVEPDPAYSRLLKTVLTRQPDVCFDIENVESCSAASQYLSGQPYDAILLALPPDVDESVQLIADARAVAPQTPVLVMVGEAADALTRAAVRAGTHGYIEKERLEPHVLMRSVQVAIARNGRILESIGASVVTAATPDQCQVNSHFPREGSAPRPHAESSPPLADRSPDRRSKRRSDPANERRHAPRFHITKPVLAIPILPDNDPDWRNRVEGYSLDLSMGGICFEIAGLHQALSKNVLVGIEKDNGEMCYSAARVKRLSESSTGIRVQAEFCQPERDLFRDENVTPHLDPETHQMTTGLNEATLNLWADVGVVRPRMVDRVLLCPACGGLPTFRHGCSACGSARVSHQQMIHHFACAHVGHLKEFERGEELSCPKCRTKKLVMGTDFEYLQGPALCLDCQRTGIELQSVGHCLSCDLRFPAHQATERDLIAYQVNRLQPLDFIGTT